MDGFDCAESIASRIARYISCLSVFFFSRRRIVTVRVSRSSVTITCSLMRSSASSRVSGRELSNESGSADRSESCDLSFVPSNLTQQCRGLIESYHEVHGYACLPDVSRKSRLGPLLESHRELRPFPRKRRQPEARKRPTSALYGLQRRYCRLRFWPAASQAGERSTPRRRSLRAQS
jgi:hypothetical protein